MQPFISVSYSLPCDYYYYVIDVKDKAIKIKKRRNESQDDVQDGYKLDMNDVPSEKLKVIVELDENNLRVSCERLWDVDK